MTTPRIEEKTFEEKSNSEEWGAWKFVSDMLDTPNPDPELAKCGIYHTSKCYEQIHNFVVEQKKKAREEERERIIKLIDWRNKGFHSGNEVVTWIDKQLEELNHSELDQDKK